MKEFTDDEKIIARNIDKKYKWVTRDKFDNLFAFNQKPHKSPSGVWISEGMKWDDMLVLNHMFKSITWEDAEPTLIRDIYDPQIDPQILDDAERKYLAAVLKPLPKVLYIKKRLFTAYTCYIYVMFANEESIAFPFFFKRHAMYSGMEGEKEYTPDELGLKL